MLNNLADKERLDFLYKFFHVLVSACVLNSGTIYEANSWTSVTAMLPPGKNVANPLTFLPAGGWSVLRTLGVSGCHKLLFEFPRPVEKLKKLNMGDERYFYVFIVATLEDGRGKGLASKVVSQILHLAQQEGKNVWLEATTEQSRAVYQKLGFRVVGDIILGQGRAASDGSYQEGGPGVTIWPMVWKPTISS